MLGLGETIDEVHEVCASSRRSACDIVTLGQYLRPSKEHLPIARYVHPDEFAELKASRSTPASRTSRRARSCQLGTTPTGRPSWSAGYARSRSTSSFAISAPETTSTATRTMRAPPFTASRAPSVPPST